MLHRSTETKHTNKNEGREDVQSDLSRELPDWLQEFKEILVDESTLTEPWRNPEQRSQDTSKSSHELPMEPRAKYAHSEGPTLQESATACCLALGDTLGLPQRM